jgi:N-acetylglucosamine transport system substrate-binding protein
MKGIIPAGFETTVGATPSLSTSDKLPHQALYAGSSESFIVPAQGKNVQGGLEFLRIMLSLEAGNKFAELTGSLPVIKGVAKDVKLTPGLASAREALTAAGDNVFFFKLGDWYAELGKAIADANGALMTKSINPTAWADRIQKAADKTASDTTITKFKR